MKTVKLELTNRQQFILWSLLCWFNKPLVPDKVKHALALPKYRNAKSLGKSLDRLFMIEIVRMADYFTKQYPELKEHHA